MSANRAGFFAGACLLLLALPAQAEPMDPTIERLVLDPNCRTGEGAYVDDPANLENLKNGPGGREWCVSDEGAFKKLISQYAFAFAPTAMHAARTTGFGGFKLAFEGSYTKIDSGKDYWRRGTQGAVDPSSKKAPEQNRDPDGFLQHYSVKFQKGFGFGLELTANIGFMPRTSLVSGGADARIAILEGFRTGFMGYVPDFAIGGGVRSITGTPEFQLTVASADAQISKPIVIADSSVLTPWVGFQQLWIFGDSGLVDLTPATNAIQYCNYAGINQPGSDDPGKVAQDGQPVCAGGSPLDFNNNVVFDKARLERRRMLFGLSYRYEMLTLGGEFITDFGSVSDAQTSQSDKKLFEGEKAQWTSVVELGGIF
ncbi:MAG: hypothetical protein SFV15_06115 [Polyangiaceae bacterium]|nr:hypothetical protein [Polyangiaceae bacterium]